MKLLLITGSLYPMVGNNANLISKLLPYLTTEHEIVILSPVFNHMKEDLPDEMFGIHVHWVTRDNSVKNIRNKILSIGANNRGYTGEYGARIITDVAIELRKKYSYDAVLCTMQPYIGAVAASRISGVPKVIYLMDPPDYLVGGDSWKQNEEYLMDSLKKMDAIITTPFIKQAAEVHGMSKLASRMKVVGFPHITVNSNSECAQDFSFDPYRINLLFCGALFPSVRDPSCFLQILEKLDERFCVTFMGRNCEDFWKSCSVSTRADVRIYPQQPYQVAVNAMRSADIMINIGNNMGVHMPSKTLDYINTGKPIVNFYKFLDCPTLYYTKRYPLCLNIFENEFNLEKDPKRFVEFCLTNRGKTVPRSVINDQFTDCKPEYIAAVLMNELKRISIIKDRKQ